MVAFEPLAQEVGEQVAIAEPFAARVDAMKEQVVPFDVLQQRLPVAVTSQRRCERTADPFADRSFQQVLEQPRFEYSEHILGEVFADRLVAARHVVDQRARVGVLVQRDRREL
ncbi:hypothetical protein [Nocardia salmonicida]|uniref:hypothetical protein n=1 Tax=Nocardia salmonicida TaxID=53431 RepID=UPI0033CE4E85